MYLKRKIYDRLIDWKSNSSLTLELKGARQVGKTYIVKKFARENFIDYTYINLLELSGKEFLKCVEVVTNWQPGQPRSKNPLLEIFTLFDKNFKDKEDTLVIIDEIQESATVYNFIREFTRNFKARFIVTGSYLGRLMNPDFTMSSGDLMSLRIEVLTFEEFLDAMNLLNEFYSLDMFGQAEPDQYQKIEDMFNIYCKIGGYPAVVMEYIRYKSLAKCTASLEYIIELFSIESTRYYTDILDAAAYDNLFCGISRIFVREKKGLEQDNFNEDLQKLVRKDYSSNLSKKECNRAINWLYSSGILDFAGKIIELNILDFKSRSRCYFTDMGLAYYFMNKIGVNESTIKGFLYENFVYLEIRRRQKPLNEIAFETPAFATYAGGEIDFVVKSNKNDKIYALEVKAGKNAAKTTVKALEQGKIDFILYLKGNTKGGIAEKIITIPIYAFSRYRFS